MSGSIKACIHAEPSGRITYMANFSTTIRTPLRPAPAFDYMADARHFAEWDPGTLGVVQVTGEGASPESVFDVEVKGVVGSTTFRYRTTGFEPPERVRLEATTRMFTAIDVIEVAELTPGQDGSLVTYSAELRLNGPLAVFDAPLGIAFRRIGARAAEGLARALAGTRVAS
jgi:hypothetical protein